MVAREYEQQRRELEKLLATFEVEVDPEELKQVERDMRLDKTRERKQRKQNTA